jgi:4-amino-4-deoxy-L-arabinose transferase-like glycosyltransferase
MAAVILSISIEYLFLSRLVVHDISLAVGITSSLLLFYYGFLQNKIHRWVIPFFYVSLAWSVLAKGPLGLVLPGLVMGLYIFLKRDWTLIKELQLGLGMIIFLPLVATWYVPISLQNKDFLSYFIFHQHLRQFLSNEAHHSAPVYYYLPVFLGGFFPWSCFVPYAWFTVSSPLKKLLDRKADLFILLWFTVPFIFFSIARSKNSTYILPIYPAASIMVAKLWMELILNFSAKSKGIRFSLVGLISFLMAAFIFIIMYYPSYWYIGIILFAGTALSLLFLFLKKSILSFCVLSANSVIVLVVVIVYLIPLFSPLYSTKNLSLYLKQVISPSDKLAEYKRITNSTVFYSDRLIPVIKGRDNLLECMKSKGGWYLLIDEKDYLKNQIEITKRSKVIYQEGDHMLLTNKEAGK